MRKIFLCVFILLFFSEVILADTEETLTGYGIFSSTWSQTTPLNTGAGATHEWTTWELAGNIFTVDTTGVGWNNQTNCLKFSSSTGLQDRLRFYTVGGWDQSQLSLRMAFKANALGGWVNTTEMTMVGFWWTGSTGQGPYITLYQDGTDIKVRLWYLEEVTGNTLILAAQTVTLGTAAAIANNWYQLTFLWRYSQPGNAGGVTVNVYSGDGNTLLGTIVGNSSNIVRSAGIDTVRLSATSINGSTTTMYYDILYVDGIVDTSPTLTILSPQTYSVSIKGITITGGTVK